MSRRDIIKSVARKAPIVVNSAMIINQKYENGEITDNEAYEQMIKFINSGNFLSYWTEIKNLIKQNYEAEKWFWLIKRVTECYIN
jgi:hypothetical protein